MPRPYSDDRSDYYTSSIPSGAQDTMRKQGAKEGALNYANRYKKNPIKEYSDPDKAMMDENFDYERGQYINSGGKKGALFYTGDEKGR